MDDFDAIVGQLHDEHALNVRPSVMQPSDEEMADLLHSYQLGIALATATIDGVDRHYHNVKHGLAPTDETRLSAELTAEIIEDGPQAVAMALSSLSTALGQCIHLMATAIVMGDRMKYMTPEDLSDDDERHITDLTRNVWAQVAQGLRDSMEEGLRSGSALDTYTVHGPGCDGNCHEVHDQEETGGADGQ